MEKIDRLKNEIAVLETYLEYLNYTELSRGLNHHDFKQYKDCKNQLESKQNQLLSYESGGQRQLSA